MEFIIEVIIWGLCGWACYSMALKKNRNESLWAVMGVLFGIFAIIVLALLPVNYNNSNRF